MNEHKRNALREVLLQYPGATEELVEQQLYAYEERENQKSALIERGFSNALAEAWLDRSGFPRPPGWHSVFFYPGSMRPRNSVVFWFCVIGIGIWLFVK